MHCFCECRPSLTTSIGKFNIPIKQWSAPTKSNGKKEYEFLKQKIAFDAIFAASDLLAITAMGAITQHGLRIPQDVSVVGYDDIGMAEHTYPPLTTVRQPMDLAGQALVQNLMRVLSDKHADSQVVKTDLIIRNSTCPV